MSGTVPYNEAMARYLPLGVDDFPTLRTHPTALYIDKTEQIAQLLDGVRLRPHLFLARPRRFGKTLLVSTLQALFEGRRDLFADTWIANAGHWDWERRQCPVLRLDMGIRGIHDPRRLQARLTRYVRDIASQHAIALEPDPDPDYLLTTLIQGLARRHQRKIVVLIDEYDTPITENIEHPATLEGILDVMRAFYGALKTGTPTIQHTFVTGITRFARAGLFSGANHLQDLSFDPECNALLGFTEAEIRCSPALQADIAHCAAQLATDRAALQQALQAYYDGYRFSVGGEAVYNPFSLAACLEALRKPRAGLQWNLTHLPNAWANSGTPALLFRLWRAAQHGPDFMAAARNRDPVTVLETANYDVATPDLSALMYHTGYLTLKFPTARAGDVPYLDFPNQEVQLTFRQSLQGWQRNLVAAWYQQANDRAGHLAAQWTAAWQNAAPAALHACLDTFLLQFPYPLHNLPLRNKELYDYEAHYQTILFAACLAMRLPVQAEAVHARGRSDLIIAWDRHIVLIECKVHATADEALAQVWRQGYADPYRAQGASVTVWGLQFDTERRTLGDCAAWSLGSYDTQTQRWQCEPCRVPLAQLPYRDAAEQERILRDWHVPAAAGATRPPCSGFGG